MRLRAHALPGQDIEIGLLYWAALNSSVTSVQTLYRQARSEREPAPLGEAFQRRSVQCITPSGLHRMSYVEWGGAPRQPVLVCVHGLTRCAHDFNFLARAVRDRYRVICVDLPGRGESEWLLDPAEYTVPTYLACMVTLIARLNAESVDWVGTSLGGMVGMALAALPDSPVRRLVLNDVGPVLTDASLSRIGAFVGKAPHFPTFEAAEQYVRMVSVTFGPHSDSEWRFLTENVVCPHPGGGWCLRYDPAIAEVFNSREAGKDIDIWPLYDSVRCPTLVMRGEHSDLLTRETVQAMVQRGPRAQVAEIPGVGHAPTLIHPDQIEVVREFLLT
jgi:pimeloyl-ACP methyl ester carboxylesterase